MSHNYQFEYYQKKVQLKTEVQCEVKCLLRLHHLVVFEVCPVTNNEACCIFKHCSKGREK